jgi:hypothetical protein
MLSHKLYFDLQKQPPFQCIFKGKIARFLFASGFYLGKAVKNDQSFACNYKLVINKNKHELRLFHRFPTGFNHIKDGKYKLYIINKESHTKHQIPACLATNYILTSKGSHHFNVFSNEK